jgi:signal transduction histidine kinase
MRDSASDMVRSRATVFGAARMLPVMATALALAIFLVDTATTLDIAIAVLYVVVVLLCANFLNTRGVVLVASGCAALTVASFLLSHGLNVGTPLVRCLVSLAAIAATTFLITQRNRAQQALDRARAELAHVARVVTLGELTASIAHEVRQPLAGITTNGSACLRWLARVPPELDEARRSVERMIADAMRASEVVMGLRALSRKTDPVRVRLNLDEVVDEVVALIRRELIDNNVTLRLELDRTLPQVRGDRVQLKQVIMNLLINGIQAMAGVDDRPRRLVIRSQRDGTEMVRLEVQDSGSGIDANSMHRLFDAFFTTKPDGMGMGLSICRSIIESHGGRIWASPNTGPGATFQFSLPVVEEARSKLDRTAPLQGEVRSAHVDASAGER